MPPRLRHRMQRGLGIRQARRTASGLSPFSGHAAPAVPEQAGWKGRSAPNASTAGYWAGDVAGERDRVLPSGRRRPAA
jgi:hypothetical protein